MSGWGDDGDEAEYEEELNEEVEPVDEIGSNAVALAKPQPPTSENELDSVHRYLRAMGEIPETVLCSSYDDMVAYLQGRIH